MGQIALPFSVEPVPPARVQFWAQYAAQVSTCDQASVVYCAYNGLWWDMSAVYDFGQVVQALESGDCSSVLFWLDLLLGAVSTALDESAWSGVLQSLASFMVSGEPVQQWYEQASCHVEGLTSLRAQVAQHVFSVVRSGGVLFRNIRRRSWRGRRVHLEESNERSLALSS